MAENEDGQQKPKKRLTLSGLFLPLLIGATIIVIMSITINAIANMLTFTNGCVIVIAIVNITVIVSKGITMCSLFCLFCYFCYFAILFEQKKTK